jgi:hypothetical protein
MSAAASKPRGSNITPKGEIKTKRHATRDNGSYDMSVWKQQLKAASKKWQREEEKRKRTKVSAS